MATKPKEPTPETTAIQETEPLTWMFWKKQRYIVVLLAFFGFFNLYTMRTNLSVAIVAMTANQSVIRNGTKVYIQEFDWNSKEQGLILSSFFYGYILTQLAGGYVSAKIGGHLVFGAGTGLTSLFTLLTPLAAKHSIEMILVLRTLEGVSSGVTFPSIHAVWAKWAPPFERTRMASLAFSGMYLGIVIAMPVSGILATSLGWESVFYVFGAIGCIWYIIWVCIVRESPEKDRLCKMEEAEFIAKAIGIRSTHKIIHPLGKIFTSRPVYAIVASHFAHNWGYYTLLTQLPTFLRDVFGYVSTKSGFFSAIPYFTMGILTQVSGFLADWTRVKGYLSTTQVRKYFNCSAYAGQAVFMMLTAYVLQPFLTMLFCTLAIGLGAFAWSGFAVNHLDIAPQHASFLMGFSNTFGTIPGIVSPVLTGYIVQNKSIDEWRIVFYICAGVYVFGCVVYWFWVSGELQDWAKIPEATE